MSIRKRYLWLLVTAFIMLLIAANTSWADDYQITGPYKKNNLSVYLIHGKDTLKEQNYLTLDEAMRKKKVKIYETSNVNQLSMENLSNSDSIYIQAGDIVKGGKQDRTFSTDMVLAPGDGKVNIESFCVEQGRWQKRGNEPSQVFHSSTKKLTSKELRLAARLKNSQSDVWNEVSKVQEKLSKKLGHDVKSNSSSTSLQLALENKQLVHNVADYKKTLLPLLDNKTDVIGYAFAINGQLNTADIYGNHTLLKKLWLKVVDSAATESVAEYDAKQTYANPEITDIKEWISDKNTGKKITRNLKFGLHQDTVENSSDVRFDTYKGIGTNKTVYRKSYIKK